MENNKICLNCSHCENIDYIHGKAICAALEGETVIPHHECVCPKDILDEVESLLRDNKNALCAFLDKR